MSVLAEVLFLQVQMLQCYVDECCVILGLRNKLFSENF
jgi:hypothetical protein